MQNRLPRLFAKAGFLCLKGHQGRDGIGLGSITDRHHLHLRNRRLDRQDGRHPCRSCRNGLLAVEDDSRALFCAVNQICRRARRAGRRIRKTRARSNLRRMLLSREIQSQIVIPLWQSQRLHSSGVVVFPQVLHGDELSPESLKAFSVPVAHLISTIGKPNSAQ